MRIKFKKSCNSNQHERYSKITKQKGKLKKNLPFNIYNFVKKTFKGHSL